MRAAVCKHWTGRVASCATAALALHAGCAAPHRAAPLPIDNFYEAAARPLTGRQCIVVSDPAELAPLCTPLGSPRLALLTVRSSSEWRRLCRATRDLGLAPDFRTGIVVGLLARAGEPIDGRWPLELMAVRACGRTAMLEGRLEPGTYLPDATPYLETAFAAGVTEVIAVDVNGDAFYPN